MEPIVFPTPDPGTIHLYYDPPGTLRMTVAGERSYPVVKLYQAWPLSMPGRHISLQDSKGEEILMLDSLDVLDQESRTAAEEEIRRRYLTARVTAVLNVKTEFGVTYWNVDTEKGERDFVVQSLTESCIWLSDRHALIVDVDGNRFEIEDLTALDPLSKAQLAKVF